MEQPRLEPHLGEEKPLVPPKSLGELGIELAQEHAQDGIRYEDGPCWWAYYNDSDAIWLGVTWRDIQELRERLYHRGFRGLGALADPTLEASILFLRETHINPYKWRP